MRVRPILFAGGGSGGHVFPLIAVADTVRSLAPRVPLVFVGTARGMETKVVPERGYVLELIEVLPLRGGGALGALKGAVRVASALVEARRLVARLDPAAVFSIGGYAAGPVALAARSRGVPVALMEPNVAIGLANRLMAPFVTRAYLAFPESERHFRAGRTLQTGVPLRAGFAPRPYVPPDETLELLVLGGSQGAQVLNEAVPAALARLGVPWRAVHQCGARHLGDVEARYRSLGVAERVTVRPFIDDVPAALGRAHLVVGRAGASAFSEICAVGRPSLLVPYPFAGDHQRLNAEALVRRGAALCVYNAEATPERLAREIEVLLAERSKLSKMAEAARRLGRPEAALCIARDLLALAGLETAVAVPSASAAPEVNANGVPWRAHIADFAAARNA